jgi:hypothetical protein
MKKEYVISLLLVNTLVLFSCFGGNRFMIFDDSDKKADAILEQVLGAIENKDKHSLNLCKKIK